MIIETIITGYRLRDIPPMRLQMDKVNLTRETLAALAPKLASLSEEILFGDIWQRPRAVTA